MGYCEYRKTWAPFLGEVLQCRVEPDNPVDKYVVAVMKKDSSWALDESEEREV